jgi:uncharacterized integral membrane protein
VVFALGIFSMHGEDHPKIAKRQELGIMKNKLLLIGLIVVVAVARYAVGNYEFSQAGSVTEIFIIRGVGSLFMDFRLKLFLTMATVALMVVDWRRNKRPDYFWVGGAGTLIAALLEILAIASGERQIQVNYLFGVELPLIVDLPVRAIAEFAFYVETSSPEGP